jgi:3-phosphoshikimate 1-carboxyvinyltransferase
VPPTLADPLPIRPRGALDARVAPPGSRSITNRALAAAALARGVSRLSGVDESDDTLAMREGLRALGVAMDLGAGVWGVHGTGGRLRAPAAPVDVGASGTTARFLTSLATLADGPVVIDGSPRMRERPIADLVEALRALGAGAEILGRAGCPPVRLAGGGLAGGVARVEARRSSQYVSGLLLAAPCARADVTLELADGALVSRPFVDLTLEVMRAFGAEPEWRGDAALHVPARGYRARDYAVEPDAQSAVYAFAAAAIAGGRVRVEGIPAGSQQTDLRFLDALARMGCRVRREADAIEVANDGALRGLCIDMNDMPDAALALAVVALFARGPTEIRNVANLRIKETDRLAALQSELERLGARVKLLDDGLRIEPAPLHGAVVDTYDDHRMAMSFALAGLRVPGVAIRDPACVRKTWPRFFEELARW